MIELRLLGAFAIIGDDGIAVEIEGRKGRALLAYLASGPERRRTREQVCGLLWGDRGELQARSSLRQLLSSLRKTLRGAGGAILASRDSLGLDGPLVSIDTEAFDGNLRRGTQDSLQAAIELYRGTFLEGLELTEPGFEDWIAGERRRLHEAAARACRTLMGQAEASGDTTMLKAAAARLLELEPGDEEGHRTLMRLHAAADNVPAALRQFRRCREILLRDLDIAPSPATERLAEAIRQGQAGAGCGSDGVLSPIDPHIPPTAGPTVAVVPFETADDDPAERRFASGLAQDISAELSRFRSLIVRVSGGARADFVVTGRVSRQDERVRIAARLIDSQSGAHIWGDHYDCPQDAVFSALDDVVATVAGTLIGRVEACCADRARRKAPASLEAFECVLRGDALPVGDQAAEAEARALYEQAVALDPGYARARAMLAYSLSLDWFADLQGSQNKLEQALDLARGAVALDPCDSISQGILGWVHLLRKSFELAERHKRRALELAPNSAYETACMGVLWTFNGDTDLALACYSRARELDPYFEPAWFWRMQGMAHFTARRYDDAIAYLEQAPTMPLWVLAYLAASHALAGRPTIAADLRGLVLQRAPTFSKLQFIAKEPFRRAADRNHLSAGLSKAGFSD